MTRALANPRPLVAAAQAALDHAFSATGAELPGVRVACAPLLVPVRADAGGAAPRAPAHDIEAERASGAAAEQPAAAEGARPVTHHTDSQGADRLVETALRQLAELRELDGRPGQPVHSEAARLALHELVIATRRNDPLQHAVKQLCRVVGPECAGRHVRAVLLELQLSARMPVYGGPPLPRGVSTPVPVDDDRTPVLGSPTVAIEVDATPERAPTRRVRGPWPDPGTSERERRGRR